MELDEKTIDLYDAWICYELSNVNQSFRDYLKNLEKQGYIITNEEGITNESK